MLNQNTQFIFVLRSFSAKENLKLKKMIGTLAMMFSNSTIHSTRHDNLANSVRFYSLHSVGIMYLWSDIGQESGCEISNNVVK